MKFDKIAGKVGYNDEHHVYIHMDTGVKYISVTTLIGEFVPPFDADYWSTYKAVKDILDAGEDWKPWWLYKKKAGNWEKVPKFFATPEGKEDITPAQLKAIASRKEDYLMQWDATREHSCELGTAVHNELESAAYHCQRISSDEVNYDVSDQDILEIQNFTPDYPDQAYPELLIYNDEYQLAGQADKVFREGRYVDIHDYKTCKEITKESFMNKKMKFPLHEIPNANYWKHELQLSIYAWMLEKMGFIVRNLYVHWLHGEEDDRSKLKTFQHEYRKDLVQDMMMVRKAQLAA